MGNVGYMSLDARDVIPVGSVLPDADAIRKLINVWDHRCNAPHWQDCPHDKGAVTRFAGLLRRGRQSFYNLHAPGKRIGYLFAAQIADALHVGIADITLPGEGETEDPQPLAEAS